MAETSRRDFVKRVPASPAAAGWAGAAAARTEARAVWLHPANLNEADPVKGKEHLRSTRSARTMAAPNILRHHDAADDWRLESFRPL